MSKDYDNAVDNVLTSFELLFSLVSSSRVRRTLQGQHDRVLEARPLIAQALDLGLDTGQ